MNSSVELILFCLKLVRWMFCHVNGFSTGQLQEQCAHYLPQKLRIISSRRVGCTVLYVEEQLVKSLPFGQLVCGSGLVSGSGLLIIWCVAGRMWKWSYGWMAKCCSINTIMERSFGRTFVNEIWFLTHKLRSSCQQVAFSGVLKIHLPAKWSYNREKLNVTEWIVISCWEIELPIGGENWHSSFWNALEKIAECAKESMSGYRFHSNPKLA